MISDAIAMRISHRPGFQDHGELGHPKPEEGDAKGKESWKKKELIWKA